MFKWLNVPKEQVEEKVQLDKQNYFSVQHAVVVVFNDSTICILW